MIPVGLVGLTFGVVAVSAGLSPLQACVMSLTVFAGGAQLAAVGIIATGGAVAAVAAGLLVNARYLGLGAAMAPRLRGSVFRRGLAAQLLIDESAAIAIAEPEPERAEAGFWLTGVLLYVSWNFGTAAGALAGSSLADPRALGLDAAIGAGMLALVAPLLTRRRERLAGLLGAGIAIAAVPLAPTGVPYLVAGLGAVVARNA